MNFRITFLTVAALACACTMPTISFAMEKEPEFKRQRMDSTVIPTASAPRIVRQEQQQQQQESMAQQAQECERSPLDRQKSEAPQLIQDSPFFDCVPDHLLVDIAILAIDNDRQRFIDFISLCKRFKTITQHLDFNFHLKITEEMIKKSRSDVSMAQLFLRAHPRITIIDASPTTINMNLLCKILHHRNTHGELIPTCPHLEALIFHNCPWIYPLVGKSKLICRDSLKKLDLSNTNIDDNQLAFNLTIFPNLEELCLAHCSQLHNLKIASSQLKKLDLSGTSIDDSQLARIMENCPNLEDLVLNNCQRLNFILVSSKLKRLDVSHTPIEGSQLASIIEKCPNLEELVLNGYAWRDIENIASNKLKKLSLSRSKIDDEQLATILFNCPHLTELNLKECLYLRSPAIIDGQNLIKLDLFGCKKLVNLILFKNKLQSLNLFATQINDSKLAIILEQCPYLIQLDISGCGKLVNPIINCPRLTQLTIPSCSATINCPALTKLDIWLYLKEHTLTIKASAELEVYLRERYPAINFNFIH